jgi:tetratricopeptide (TPR) repeat protein
VYHAKLDSNNVRHYSDKAIDDFTQCITLKPDVVEYYRNRAMVYYVRGEEDNALNDYAEVLRLDLSGTAKFWETKYYFDRAVDIRDI